MMWTGVCSMKLSEAALPLERTHEARTLKHFQHVQRDTAGKVDTARSEHLERQIGRLARQNRNERVYCGRAQPARILWLDSGFNDDCGAIRCGRDQFGDFGVLRDLFDGFEIVIDVWNPDSRANMLETAMVVSPSI